MKHPECEEICQNKLHGKGTCIGECDLLHAAATQGITESGAFRVSDHVDSVEDEARFDPSRIGSDAEQDPAPAAAPTPRTEHNPFLEALPLTREAVAAQVAAPEPAGGMPDYPNPVERRPDYDYELVPLTVYDALRAHAEQLQERVRELEQRDDITMTAFEKLEKKFKDQVSRAEQAEARLELAQEFVRNFRHGTYDEWQEALGKLESSLTALAARREKEEG